MKIEILKNIQTLQNFLSIAGDSLLSFRYFSKRPLQNIFLHEITLIGYDNDKPIAYGHLDKEKEIVWLGICVIWPEHGKGYGKQMMTALKEAAMRMGIEKISLAVDIQNTAAICFYEKSGFKKISSNDKLFFYEHSL
jgi:RimJ/RimL family protein N-acetyltransferase